MPSTFSLRGISTRRRHGNPTSCRRGSRIGAGVEHGSKTGIMAALQPARFVMPNAVKRARSNGGRSEKNAVSVGLAPGQPPSNSRRRARRARARSGACPRRRNQRPGSRAVARGGVEERAVRGSSRDRPLEGNWFTRKQKSSWAGLSRPPMNTARELANPASATKIFVHRFVAARAAAIAGAVVKGGRTSPAMRMICIESSSLELPGGSRCAVFRHDALRH